MPADRRIIDALKELSVSNMLPMHMPGHKRNAGLPIAKGSWGELRQPKLRALTICQTPGNSVAVHGAQPRFGAVKGPTI